MGFIHENDMLIIVVLLLLLIATITVAVIVYIQHNEGLQNQGKKRSDYGAVDNNQKNGSHSNKSNYHVSHKELKKLKAEKENLDKEYLKLHNEYLRIKDDYGKSASEIIELQGKIRNMEVQISNLTRENDELNKLLGKEEKPIVEEKTSESVSPVDASKVEYKEETSSADAKEVEQPNKEEQQIVTTVEQTPNENTISVETPKEVTMYASFPRSADNRIYFSDLTEIRGEDSYFELKISNVTGKAIFKPLDFMKIRNYDPAMTAMLTEGVKPNVASSVIGIEHGSAHIEGKDWIIDNLAKIKLA